MPGQKFFGTGEEWQKWVQLLLKRHYVPNGYLDVPDHDKGDLGIEGFSRDGCVFQCYAIEEPVDTSTRYAKLRDKISDDIRKFIRNKDRLRKLFGPTKISRWILVVPYYDSKKILEHAEAKATEVREANLSYVADDFFIHIATEEDFAVEAAQLRNANLSRIDLSPEKVPETDIEAFLANTDNSRLIDNLNRKLLKIPAFQDQLKRQKMINQLIGYYIMGQNQLENLRDHYPDLYEKVVRCKRHREIFLELDCLISLEAPNQLLTITLNRYEQELIERVAITKQTTEIFKWEAISD